ncbi:sulfatase-like hydrolase/transferase [Novipirellula artificiosorum]|uniref:sulfatase-like hydrolase/transferase n=1 Tax=Novipirellula artificiosorum TaxID=2528016 RepID=UPI0011B63523
MKIAPASNDGTPERCYDVLPGRILSGVKRDAVDFDPPINDWNLPKKQRILPEFLKQIGYRTGAFGKWHVGRVQPKMPQRKDAFTRQPSESRDP